MNISFTWANYALLTGVCLGGYYLVIGLIYYRKDIIRLLHPNEKNRISLNAKQEQIAVENSSFMNLHFPDNPLSVDAVPVSDKLPGTQPNVQDFVDEIEAYTKACEKNITREALVGDLRKILHKYPSLLDSSLQYLLLEVINTATENNCSIHWSADELNELWNG